MSAVKSAPLKNLRGAILKPSRDRLPDFSFGPNLFLMISWFRFGLLASLALCLSTSVSAAPTISSQSGVGSQLNSTNRKQGGGTLELPSTTTNQHSTDNGTRS